MNKEMLMALGGMILLAIVIMNVNKNSLYTEDVMHDSNFGILATSIGTSIIEDASKKSFDNISDTSDVTALADLTAHTSLGIDAGETLNNTATYNDFDDFNGYSITDSSMPSAVFRVSATVVYVNAATPNVTLAGKSWHKKITVKVWSKSMRDTMIQSSIFSYWNFR